MHTAKALLLAFVVLMLLFGTLVFAQPSIVWQKCLGGSLHDYAYSIQQTSDGGFIVAGYSKSNDGDVSIHHGSTLYSDYWIVKLNSSGDIVWHKCLGGSHSDSARSIQQTSDGGYIVAGYTASNDGDVSGNHGLGDYWIVRLNSSGRIEWQKCLGGNLNDMAYSIQQTSDGGFIVAGYTQSHDGDVSGNHGNADYWVVKLNSAGNIEWQKCLGGSNYDRAYSIQQTSDGGFIVAGYTRSNDGDVSGNHGTYDYWVVKLDSSGRIEWQKCLGGSAWDEAYSIQQTSDGGFIITGYSESNDGDVSGSHSNDDYWIVKLNSSGRIVWQKCLGGSSWDRAYCVQKTFDGGFILAGGTESNDGDVSGNHGDADYWVVKLSPSGVSENVVIPEKFKLSVFPNPFNSSCMITAPSGAKVKIYDLQGRLISKGIQPFAESQGKRTLIWQPDETIRSGVYFVKATMENGRKSLKRVVLVK